jgi:hypothetical protein
MELRLRTLNKELKHIDRNLFAKKESNGVVHLYRKSGLNASDACFVTALTHNWAADGSPREWGIEVIKARLRAMDLWRDNNVVDELMLCYEKQKESERKDFRNNVESFLYDFRRQFARATSDINTSLLPKIDKRRQAQA